MPLLRTLMMNHLWNILLISYWDTQGPPLPVHCWPWAVCLQPWALWACRTPSTSGASWFGHVTTVWKPRPALTVLCDSSHPALPFLNLLAGLSVPLLLIKALSAQWSCHLARNGNWILLTKMIPSTKHYSRHRVGNQSSTSSTAPFEIFCTIKVNKTTLPLFYNLNRPST